MSFQRCTLNCAHQPHAYLAAHLVADGEQSVIIAYPDIGEVGLDKPEVVAVFYHLLDWSAKERAAEMLSDFHKNIRAARNLLSLTTEYL